MLGAIAALALGSLFAAAPAHAAPPTPAAGLGCTLVTSPNNWPANSHYYYCGSNSATHKMEVQNRLGTLPAHLKAKINTNGKVYVYVWDDYTEYNAYYGSSVTQQNAIGWYGVTSDITFVGDPNTYITINIFEKVYGHDTCPNSQACLVSKQTLAHSATHELGHTIDKLYNYPSQGQKFFGEFVSNLGNSSCTDGCVNGLSESAMFPHGIPFPNRWNYVAGGWSTGWSPPPLSDALRNEKILKLLFPWWFDGAPNVVVQRGELFVELFIQYGNGHVNEDWDNPYVGGTSIFVAYPPYPNGANTLSKTELFSKFKMARPGTGGYFQKLMTDPTFVP